MTTKRTKLDKAKEENQLAAIQLDTMRKRAILNKYDVLEPNRSRRQASHEFKNEDGIFDMTKRLKGCNLGRDLERNYSPAKSILHQFRMNTVGSMGKLQVNAEGGGEAAAWFNEVWAKDPDYKTDLHWSDWLQNTVAAIIREGDQLTVFDDNLTDDDSGKLITWEADQVVPLTQKAFEKAMYKDRKAEDIQENGIIRNKHGRELAYIATGKRGMTVIDTPDDVTIWMRGLAKLIRNPWRHNQGRGVPSLITPAANFLDLYEILASELQTAKKAAKQYANVKRTDAVTDWDDPGSAPEFLPENSGKTAATVDAEGANVATANGAQNYERLEAFAGGFVDYLDVGDEVQIPDLKHPNSQLAPFMDSVHGMSGAALGLASAYTKMRADSSYTAFRGDMIMSWVTFYAYQKWLERQVADWIAVKAIQWGIRKGEGFEAPPAGWERKLAWTWPRMPEVKEIDAQNAVEKSLKNGTTDFSALLGPDWKDKLDAYAEQVEYVREKGLPLNVLETKSGGTTEDTTEETESEGVTGDE